MKNKQLALILIITCSIFTAFGMIFWKIGANKLELNLSILTNYSLWLGFILYGIGTLILMLSLKYGNLSLVHPFLSLGLVWAAFLAYFYLKETFPMLKILGTSLIILGTFLVYKGDKK